MAAINVTDLTTGTVEGTGVFDELMKITKAHIHEEYNKNRIKGSEYSTVYLGAVQAVMDRSLQFLLQQQKTDLEAQLLEQQVANAVTENQVMQKQICKLDAEFDVLVEQKLKTIQETALLSQKKTTEQAQTNGVGVDADSVIGKQKLLYAEQTEGYKRNAEQKAAKLLIDTWNVRRTTDGATQANIENQLTDVDVGNVVAKLKAGVNA